MTVVAIHQPNYLPWIGFFHKLARADVYVSLDSVQFNPRSYTNRCQILGQGGPLLLTVPIGKEGRHRRIDELRIADHDRWAEKHYLSFERNYRRAPYWNEHGPFLRELYLERRWERLVDLNEAAIRYVMDYLGIRCPLVRASELGVEGQSTELLLGLTRAVGGTVYLSGPTGRQYMDESRFAAEGVGLRYNEFVYPTYPQHRSPEFVPNLSVFDLLLNLGPESRRLILDLGMRLTVVQT
ncbi:WbqC family protein [Symbiobacterium terraclitae]|uniref:WbqC family protein n=1 Tax=Symbiobacterium terraclitae TaxID=557451 RepID=UPI0035B50DBA